MNSLLSLLAIVFDMDTTGSREHDLFSCRITQVPERYCSANNQDGASRRLAWS